MACLFCRGECLCLYSRHFGSVVADRIFGACSGHKRKCDGLRPSCATISLANTYTAVTSKLKFRYRRGHVTHLSHPSKRCDK